MTITIGAKIEQYFDYLGYNYNDLDSALGLSRSEVDNIFSSKQEVTPDQLAVFAQIFNTSVDNLQNGLSLDEEVKNIPEQFESLDLPESDKLELSKFTRYLNGKK